MTIESYTKRPVTIRAIQVTDPVAAHEASQWMSENGYPALLGNANNPRELRAKGYESDEQPPTQGWWIRPVDGALVIRTLEGDMAVGVGDYLIHGTAGEFYPCKPDIFENIHERGGYRVPGPLPDRDEMAGILWSIMAIRGDLGEEPEATVITYERKAERLLEILGGERAQAPAVNVEHLAIELRRRHDPKLVEWALAAQESRDVWMAEARELLSALSAMAEGEPADPERDKAELARYLARQFRRNLGTGLLPAGIDEVEYDESTQELIISEDRFERGAIDLGVLAGIILAWASKQ